MSAVSYFQQNITFRKSNPFAFSREKAGASIQFGLLGYLITDNNKTDFFNTPSEYPSSQLFTCGRRVSNSLKRSRVISISLLDALTDPVTLSVLIVISALIIIERLKSKFRFQYFFFLFNRRVLFLRQRMSPLDPILRPTPRTSSELINLFPDGQFQQ